MSAVALAEAARELAAFARTAPGRLPQRVQDAIAVAMLSLPADPDARGLQAAGAREQIAEEVRDAIREALGNDSRTVWPVDLARADRILALLAAAEPEGWRKCDHCAEYLRCGNCSAKVVRAGPARLTLQSGSGTLERDAE